MIIEQLRTYGIAVKASAKPVPFNNNILNNTLASKEIGEMSAYIGIQPKNGEFKACLKCGLGRCSTLRD